MPLNARGLVVVGYLVVMGIATLAVGTVDFLLAVETPTATALVGAIGAAAVGSALSSVGLALYFEQEWARILAVVVLVGLIGLNATSVVIDEGFDRWFAVAQLPLNLLAAGSLLVADPIESVDPVETTESATRIGTTLK